MSQSINLYKQLANHKLFNKTINFDLKRIKLVLKKLNQNVIADYYGPDQKRQEAGGYFQFHFNTNELNKYLTEQANNWGIEIVDDKVLEVMQDETGISEVKGEKDNYKSDFWIDSTGFRRVLMTPLGAKWVSYGDMLPLKEAIAFPTKELDYYPMHTQALAMKAGWKWRIPTYGRFGNGYIYDTNFITKCFLKRSLPVILEFL